MNILERKNWWIWLILAIFSQSTSTFVLGALLDVYKKDAWYAKWQNWLLAFVCLFFPLAILITVFTVQITCETASKLEVPGKEIYLSPYIWILCIIIPFIGWLAMSAMFIYLQVYILIALYHGKGEKYIN